MSLVTLSLVKGSRAGGSDRALCPCRVLGAGVKSARTGGSARQTNGSAEYPCRYRAPVELSAVVVVVGLVAAFVLGLSKTSVPSVGAFGVALLATVLPALPSTGVALPVLLLGDAVAISMYARHADRRLLLRLLPSVTVGLAAGYALVRVADPAVVARVIGAILLLTVLGQVPRRAPSKPPGVSAGAADDDEGGVPESGARAVGPVSVLLGIGAGLSTMVANAGGPMMTLYVLRMRVTTLAFLGTVAWFFLAVNLLKLPFSIGLGLITPQSLVISAAIAPGMLAGALVGRRLVRGMSRQVFEAVALIATAAAAIWLLVR